MVTKETNALNIGTAGIPVFDGVATFNATTVVNNAVVYGGTSNSLQSVSYRE